MTTAAAPTTTTTDRAWPLRLDEVFAAEGARLLVSARQMTGSRTDAEDLLQDAFVRALARPEDFVDRSDRDVVGWLWVVMRRKWRDHTALRRNSDRPLDEVIEQGSGEPAILDDQHQRAEAAGRGKDGGQAAGSQCTAAVARFCHEGLLPGLCVMR